MTGFGAGKSKSNYGTVTAEIKTVNHKFLEVSYKLPNNFSLFEDDIKGVLQKSIKRGKVYLNIVHEGSSPHSQNLFLDIPLARKYYDKLRHIKKELSLKENIRLDDITSFPGILTYKITEKDVSKIWPSVYKALCLAIERLVHEREKEAKNLCKDLKKRLTRIKKYVAIIEKKSQTSVMKYKRKLERRIKEISGMPPSKNERLEMEVALYAKNSDVSEEITRISSHVWNLERVIKKSGEVGKKMDFIAQEMHREANTIGSKASDYTISKSVIEIKSEIEKIREQVKNIE